ncbi:MAG TPA: glycosyltransferase family 2 protein [Syntrophorhabdaceae bacterium]|nr:glycosyltransferase family 2 protein [Syntrophorhabdaceae bacterium]
MGLAAGYRLEMISVVITTYNRKAFLRDAVLSVLNQDYLDKEVIVIDDGSTDNSSEVLEGLPVRYLLKENRGISSARNKGIELARGEYIAFLDVDDLWKKAKLSIQMTEMCKKDYLVSYTDEIWMRNKRHLNQKARHKKYSGLIFERCLPLCIISPSSVLMKRDVFDCVGKFDESMPVCEDYDMWLRVSAHYPVLFVDKPLIVKQGGHEDQLSKRYPAMDRFRIDSIVRILDSNVLNEQMRNAAISELTKKCTIYAKGALKRGKIAEADSYLSLVAPYGIRMVP